MKKLSIILLTTLCVLMAKAQPSVVKNISKSLITLRAYNADGTEREASYGFMIDADGTMVAPWKPFAGASRIVAVDEKGGEVAVETIAGVNELYDVCRFHLTGLKTQPLQLASKAVTAGTKVWLVQPPKTKEKAVEGSIQKAETFMEKYAYYMLAYNEAPAANGLPLLNDGGQVVGLCLASTDGSKTAVDIQFIRDLQNTGLAVNSTLYQNSCVRPELSDDSKQALLTVMLAGEQSNREKYAKYIDDFIQKFPAEVDGYTSRALLKVGEADFQGADQDLQLCLSKATNKAEAHAEYARIIYQKVLYSADTLYTEWTLDKALSEIQQAYAISAQPAYKHREAQIVFAQGHYAEAYDMFGSLMATNLRGPELFYESAQCKVQTSAPDTEVLALLDSAVAMFSKPYSQVAAPYVLARGQQYDKMGEYRKAIIDYNDYDTIMGGRATADFYYTRYRCEVSVRQYSQALNDIAHAAYLNQTEPLYFAEMASLRLRVGQTEDAILAANLCLQLEPNSTDALIIKGIALTQTGKKAEGIECLTQALELGDERAPGLIEKYSK